MKIYFASDHAGFEMKKALIEFVKELGFKVEDLGPKEFDPADDYPEFVKKVAQKVSDDPANCKAIILGGTGQGEAMVANRFPNVRTAVFYGSTLGLGFNWLVVFPLFFVNHQLKKNFLKIIKLSREHNDANILSLGARFLSLNEAKEAVKLWLDTPFSGEERHKRRISEIDL